ncbi:DUF423 domain-containing protein [Polaribacter sp.]|jgi:uncharacterized membrane protein YgdD (TMEM256/DUF423 family)|nr:DUF423 domain-containing protein [Polaribacter sp.]
MFKNFVITCFLGMLGIILGAFGAHALKEVLTSEELVSFNTAVRYQMYHVIVLLFVNMYTGFSTKQKNTISWLFFFGIFFFSGSIYAIQLTEITAKSLWFITPLGGLFFILGWAFMCIRFLSKMRKKIKK